MNLERIDDIDELKYYLATALKLEHATVPPYLTTLYSIMPGKNPEATRILRVVAVEEMLHMTLVANMLNAIGGKPDLTVEDFVPAYPSPLPDGELEFEVSLERFSPDALATFLKIEQPTPVPPAPDRSDESPPDKPEMKVLQFAPHIPPLQFDTIGEFYAEIRRGFQVLHERLGDALFANNDLTRQITPAYYYSGGGTVHPVTDLESVNAALDQIVEQGEGYGGKIATDSGELAHYYRFQQLQLGRYYLSGDLAGHPTGPALPVDYSAVYPIKKNACLADYPVGSELHAAAVDFANSYKAFLALLTEAYNGHPEKLQEAVAWMFALKEQICALIRNPIPGREENAAPIFALPQQG